MEKKYKLTDETKVTNGVVLHRIEALRDFGDIKVGDKGGYVEDERNLLHIGNAWVYDNAEVYGNALVRGNASVYDNALVRGNASVCGNASVYGTALVCGNAEVFDNAIVCGNASVYDNALVCGNASVCDNAEVLGNACVCDNAWVRGNACVCDNALVCGNAIISSNYDYIVFMNWWSSGRSFTWTRSNDMWCVGCFYGTGSELVEKAYKDSEVSGREYERIVNYVESVKAEMNRIEASKHDAGREEQIKKLDAIAKPRSEEAIAKANERKERRNAMIVQEDVPYTKEEVAEMVKTIKQLREENEYYFKQGYHIARRSTMLWMIRKGTTNVELSEYEAALNEDYEKYHDKWLKEIQQ